MYLRCFRITVNSTEEEEAWTALMVLKSVINVFSYNMNCVQDTYIYKYINCVAGKLTVIYY